MPNNNRKISRSHCVDIVASLLEDMTTKQYILWGTDNYAHLGLCYSANHQIRPELINADNSKVIIRRYGMSKANQTIRQKKQAEVYTPAWMCNAQINLIDDAWFKEQGVFNSKSQGGWIVNRNIISFPKKKGRRWQDYVDEKRLEIACGEAPYVTSRYDMVTGEQIPICERIGFLDRKLRIVNENASNEEEWVKWAFRALESVYGYEFQGDRLFIARENVYQTFCDNFEMSLNRMPNNEEVYRAICIIVWNFWQMDAMTFAIPYDQIDYVPRQISMFEKDFKYSPDYCKIRDWRKKKTITYKSLVKGE